MRLLDTVWFEHCVLVEVDKWISWSKLYRLLVLASWTAGQKTGRVCGEYIQPNSNKALSVTYVKSLE